MAEQCHNCSMERAPSTGMFFSALVFYASLSGILLPEQGMDGKGLDSEMRSISI